MPDFGLSYNGTGSKSSIVRSPGFFIISHHVRCYNSDYIDLGLNFLESGDFSIYQTD